MNRLKKILTLKYNTIFYICVCSFITQIIFAQKTTYYRKSDSLFNSGNYSEYLNENLKVLNIIKNIDNCSLQSLANFKVGKSYYYLQNKKTAIQWFRASNTYASSCDLDSMLGKNYRNIGAIYCEMALNDSSMYYLNKSRDFLKKWGNAKELSTLYAIYFELRFRNFNDIKGGEAYLDTCGAYSKKEDDANTYAFYLVKRGIFLKETGRCSSAIKYLKEAKNIYKSINQLEGQQYALTCLASAYSICGQADSCYLSMVYHNDLRDTIFKQKTAENLAKYQSLFETKKKEIENLELKRKNQLLFWLIVLGVSTVASSSFLIYKFNSIKKQKKFDEQLREQQRIRFLEVMQTQEQERTRIASDLHDGVGHLLSAIRLNISAISTLGSQDSDIANNLSKMVDAASTEVRQLSHQLMPQSLSELGLTESLNELANRINKSNSIIISLKTDLENITISKKSQIVVYRIIQEILNNIIKHAEAKTIQIDITTDKSKLIISIFDDGKFFDSKLILSSEGIGWKNIKARIELFNGMYEIISSNSNGTKINVTLFLEFETTSS